MDTAAELIRASRQRHGLSQRALALRAGTTQAWVSAIERGKAEPTVGMLRRLLLVVGEELILGARRLPSDAAHDPIAFAENRRRSPDERLAEALEWADVALGPGSASPSSRAARTIQAHD